MPTIRDAAALRFSEPDKLKRRRRRSASSSISPEAITTHQVTVDPAVMAAALRVKRPGQRVQIVSATEVRLVNG